MLVAVVLERDVLAGVLAEGFGDVVGREPVGEVDGAVVELVVVVGVDEVKGAPVCRAGWHAAMTTTDADRTSRRGIVRTAVTPDTTHAGDQFQLSAP